MFTLIMVLETPSAWSPRKHRAGDLYKNANVRRKVAIEMGRLAFSVLEVLPFLLRVVSRDVS